MAVALEGGRRLTTSKSATGKQEGFIVVDGRGSRQRDVPLKDSQCEILIRGNTTGGGEVEAARRGTSAGRDGLKVVGEEWRLRVR
jgi:hypothetical protein